MSANEGQTSRLTQQYIHYSTEQCVKCTQGLAQIRLKSTDNGKRKCAQGFPAQFSNQGVDAFFQDCFNLTSHVITLLSAFRTIKQWLPNSFDVGIA